MNAQLAASPWRIDWERLGRRLLIALLCLFGGGALYMNTRGSAYGVDFHGIWRAGHNVLNGHSPYPAAGWRRLLLDSNDFIVPPPLAVVAIPFSLLTFGAAVALWNLVSAAAFAAALRLVGVRDLRVYAVAMCSLPFVSSLGLGQPDGLFALLAAIAWRYRDSSMGAVAAGALVAAKLLAWPLVIWMLVTRRTRGAAITVVSAAGLALAGWSLIGMHGLLGYPGLLAADAHAFEARSHSLVAVAMSLGLPAGPARAAALLAALALATAIVARSRRSDLGWFTAALAFGLMSSPVMWSHYLVLLLLALAIARPRLDRLWLLTAAFWLSPMEPAHSWQLVLVAGVASVLLLRGVAPPASTQSGAP